MVHFSVEMIGRGGVSIVAATALGLALLSSVLSTEPISPHTPHPKRSSLQKAGAAAAGGLRAPEPAAEDLAPPAAAVAWALSGFAAGGAARASGGRAVGVVDLGEGERWARALHARAGAPLVLWRAPRHARNNSAPAWLEDRQGYVLAARNCLRLLYFFVLDAAHSVSDQMFGTRNLLLSSTAPIVLGVGRVPANVTTTEAVLPLVFLRMHHLSFRGLQLYDTPRQRQHCYVVKNLGQPMEIVLYPHAVYCERHVRHFSRAWSRRARNATVVSVTYAPIPTQEFKNSTFKSKAGRYAYRLLGYKYLELKELGTRLSIDWTVPKALESIMRTRSPLVERLLPEAMFLVQRGLVEFCPMPFAYLGPLRPYAMLGASARFGKLVVVVTRAHWLPAWTLPLRAFGAAVWGALLGAAAAYALAWSAVAGASLAAGAAAALRALSSCGGAPQARVRAAPQRMLLAAALLVSAVVDTAYKARLFTLITRPERWPELETLPELLRSGMPLLATEERHKALVASMNPQEPDLFAGADAETRRRLFARILTNVSTASAHRMLAQRRPFAWLLEDARWDTLTDREPRLAVRMRPMREEAAIILAAMHACRNWPWLEAVNAKLLEFDAAGLQDKWKENYRVTLNIVLRHSRNKWSKEIEEYKTAEDKVPRILDLQDLRPAFELHVAGVGLAVLLFAAELCRRGNLWRPAPAFTVADLYRHEDPPRTASAPPVRVAPSQSQPAPSEEMQAGDEAEPTQEQHDHQDEERGGENNT